METTQMEKEINEIPEVLSRIAEFYAARPNAKSPAEPPECLVKAAEIAAGTDFVHIAACGTSYHAGLALGLLLEKECKVRTKTYIASEFANQALIESGDAGIVLSQSGETADTLAAMVYMKQHGIGIISICNADESTIVRSADVNLPALAGAEVSVACTKAYCAQVLIGAILASAVHNQLHGAPLFVKKDYTELIKLSKDLIAKEPDYTKFAKEHKARTRIFFLGTGFEYFTALEAALKVKETNQMHCEGYATNEFRHGPVALVEENSVVINLAGTDPFTAPKKPLGFVCSVIPMQFLALRLAELKKLNPDNPRNLTKAVI